MCVYVVTGKYLDLFCVEKVCSDERSAIDFCDMMNNHWYGDWSYHSMVLE